MIVVADTSVVLNLCLLHQENLLFEIFESVVAATSVAFEFQRLASVDDRFRSLSFPTFIQIHTPTRVPAALANNPRLHRGEIDTLSLAVEQNMDAVLMDERPGRAIAGTLKLPCIGVLGILIQAKRMGLLPAIRPLLDQLESQALFWIAPALRQQVLRTVSEA